MPLPEELKDDLKSTVADLANVSGSRFAGMLVAGTYLREFVADGVQWTHIDIAAPAYNTGGPWGYTPRAEPGCRCGRCSPSWRISPRTADHVAAQGEQDVEDCPRSRHLVRLGRRARGLLGLTEPARFRSPSTTATTQPSATTPASPIPAAGAQPRLALTRPPRGGSGGRRAGPAQSVDTGGRAHPGCPAPAGGLPRHRPSSRMGRDRPASYPRRSCRVLRPQCRRATAARRRWPNRGTRCRVAHRTAAACGAAARFLPARRRLPPAWAGTTWPRST